MRGRHRAAPDRIAVGRRPLRASARAGGPRRGLGRARSPHPGRRWARPGTGSGSSISPRRRCIGRSRWRATTSDRVCAHASRFLADITLTIHGDAQRAAALFARSLEAARRLGDPFGLARTLLMAGWVPFWRNELDRAEAMFREALEVARSATSVGDAWAESRALVGIANVLSLMADEEEALAVALEALEVGEDANQAFTAAVAHETVAASLRRLMRLDEALEHAEARDPHVPRVGGPLGARERAGRPWRDPSDGGPARGSRDRSPRGVRPVPRPSGTCPGDLDGGRARPHPGDAGRHGGRARRSWPTRSRALADGRTRFGDRAPDGGGGAGAGRGRSRDRAGPRA